MNHLDRIDNLTAELVEKNATITFLEKEVKEKDREIDGLKEELEIEKENGADKEEWKELADSKYAIEELRDMNAADFHRFVCDVFGVIYHASKDTLMDLLNDKLTSK